MPSAIVRFRPTGPWRFGPDSGARDRVDLIFHSDSLYGAVTSAMARLDFLNEWIDATAARRNLEPEVCFSSLFPFQRDLLFVTPPRSMWPPPPSTKIRFKSARFVPLPVVQSLVADRPIDENRWIIDGESQCMIPSGEGPFRIGLRSAAAVDRLNPAAASPHVTACVEFVRDAGLWTMVVFSDDAARQRWQPRVASALRLLADSGFGGERSRGWGRSQQPEWQDAPEWWPAPDGEKAYWLLSLYAPAESDQVDWKTGNYSAVTRTGRIESPANWGELKPPAMMIAEGGVLVSPSAPRGEARNVAPSGFAHPVYRMGFAVTIPVPWRVKTAATAPPVARPAPPIEQAARPVSDAEAPAPPPVEPEPEEPAPDTESAVPPFLPPTEPVEPEAEPPAKEISGPAPQAELPGVPPEPEPPPGTESAVPPSRPPTGPVEPEAEPTAEEISGPVSEAELPGQPPMEPVPPEPEPPAPMPQPEPGEPEPQPPVPEPARPEPEPQPPAPEPGPPAPEPQPPAPEPQLPAPIDDSGTPAPESNSGDPDKTPGGGQ